MVPFLVVLAAWFLISLPAALLVGRLLHHAAADLPPGSGAAAPGRLLPTRAKPAARVEKPRAAA